MSKFAVVSKTHFTKFCPGQRRPETKGIANDDVTYPIYWNNYQKDVILGKSSQHVCFIFVSCLSQKPDLSGAATQNICTRVNPPPITPPTIPIPLIDPLDKSLTGLTLKLRLRGVKGFPNT